MKIVLDIKSCSSGCPYYHPHFSRDGPSTWDCGKIGKTVGAYNSEGYCGPLEVPDWCPIQLNKLIKVNDYKGFLI